MLGIQGNQPRRGKEQTKINLSRVLRSFVAFSLATNYSWFLDGGAASSKNKTCPTV